MAHSTSATIGGGVSIIPDKYHDCRMCGRQIKGQLPHCIYCANALRKQGICQDCGVEPVAPRAKNGAQSRYCVGCRDRRARVRMMTMEPYGERREKYRDSDHRENTFETRHGID